MRLMQTFATSALRETDVSTVDHTVIPFAREAPTEESFHARVPLLPDNFATQYAPEEVDGPIAGPRISIVAANPETVAPAALGEVEGMGIDGVELKFVHEGRAGEQDSGNTLTGIWKGLVDDVFSDSKSGGKLAV